MFELGEKIASPTTFLERGALLDLRSRISPPMTPIVERATFLVLVAREGNCRWEHNTVATPAKLHDVVIDAAAAAEVTTAGDGCCVG
jgi:hypothetical protein